DYVRDAGAEVLLAVHHTRLAHVIANVGPAEPDRDAAGWLAAVEREPDPARRMRRRLVDDTLVHTDDLDEAEAAWLSRRVRPDVVRRLAELAARFRPGRGGWSQEYTSDPDALARQVETLLTGVGLLRVHVVEEGDGEAFWWFSPASGRWPPSTIGRRTRRAAP